MHALPANFVTRTELHQLIARTDELLKDVQDPQLAHGLEQIRAGASCLEGFMAELPRGTHPTDRALDDPDGWGQRWCWRSVTLHREQGLLRFALGRQFVERPHKQLLATGRFCLAVNGHQLRVSPDMVLLRNLLICRMLELGLPESGRGFVLEQLFGMLDESPEDVGASGAA